MNRIEPTNESQKTRPSLICSFCGKSQREVRAIVAGPTVYICNECLDLCNEILAHDTPTPDAPGWVVESHQEAWGAWSAWVGQPATGTIESARFGGTKALALGHLRDAVRDRAIRHTQEGLLWQDLCGMVEREIAACEPEERPSQAKGGA
ncbi:MAG: ClpX C4-type zinc finger protein [Gemmatimonadaceae bacterium]|jgi:hypothetical protein